MQYKWLVNKVQVAENNLIVKVDLTVTAIDGDNTASAAYTRDLSRGESFIPYEQLTEQQVLDWCFEPKIYAWTDIEGNPQSISKDVKAEGEDQVKGQLQQQIAQKKSEPALPWV